MSGIYALCGLNYQNYSDGEYLLIKPSDIISGHLKLANNSVFGDCEEGQQDDKESMEPHNYANQSAGEMPELKTL